MFPLSGMLFTQLLKAGFLVQILTHTSSTSRGFPWCSVKAVFHYSLSCFCFSWHLLLPDHLFVWVLVYLSPITRMGTPWEQGPHVLALLDACAWCTGATQYIYGEWITGWVCKANPSTSTWMSSQKPYSIDYPLSLFYSTSHSQLDRSVGLKIWVQGQISIYHLQSLSITLFNQNCI